MVHPDILYLVKESENNEELRYSLRSLRNLPHNQIFIAGHKPSWVTEDIIHIKTPSQTRRKYQNIKNNLIAALHDGRLSDNFILMNDDFFIMRPISKIVPARRTHPIEHYIELFSKVDPTSYYVQSMRATRDLLHSWNFTTIYSYELHTPFLYNKTKLLALIDKLGSNCRDVLPHFRTIYGNYYQIGGHPHRDVKIIRDQQNIDTASPFLSTIDDSFQNGEIGNYIRATLLEQTIIFTHEIDTDGIGCLILAQLAFSSVEPVLVTRQGYKPIDAVTNFLNAQAGISYDHIFVTDVFPGTQNLRNIAKNPAILARFHWFDHHKISADAIQELQFPKTHAVVQITDNQHIPPCATSLFYNWLIKNNYLTPTPKLDVFVSLTKTSDYKQNNPDSKSAARNLKQLLATLGIEKYIRTITALLTTDS